MSKLNISFGPRIDDVTVDGESNIVTSASEFQALINFINSARARNSTAGDALIAEGRGDSSSMRVIVPSADGALVTRELIDLQVAFGATGAGNGNEVLSGLLARYMMHGTPAVAGIVAHRLLKSVLTVLRSVSGMPDARVFFANDGSVAVNAALRVALGHAAKKDGHNLDGCDPRWSCYKVVVAERAYHGSGGLERSFFRSPRGRNNLGPLSPNLNVVHVPFGDIHALERTFASRDGRVAAVLLEPVQGTGGCMVPPSGYLAAVGALCRQQGAVFIADEIRSGFGRLGEFFYSPSVGAEPDLICGGKSAASGVVPFSFVIGKPALMEELASGIWGVTWNASPFQCMALLQFAKQLDEGLLDNIRQKSGYLAQSFGELQKKYPKQVSGFNGTGLMRCLETVYPASKIVQGLLSRGVFTSPVFHPDYFGEVLMKVYVTPALTITEAQIDTVVVAVEDVIKELSA